MTKGRLAAACAAAGNAIARPLKVSADAETGVRNLFAFKCIVGPLLCCFRLANETAMCQ